MLDTIVNNCVNKTDILYFHTTYSKVRKLPME